MPFSVHRLVNVVNFVPLFDTPVPDGKKTVKLALLLIGPEADAPDEPVPVGMNAVEFALLLMGPEAVAPNEPVPVGPALALVAL